MSDITVEKVTSKINSVAYESLDKAMRLTKDAGHRHLELLHWLYYLIRNENSDLFHILRHFDVDLSAVDKDLQAALAELKINRTSHNVEAVSRGVAGGVVRRNAYPRRLQDTDSLRAACDPRGREHAYPAFSVIESSQQAQAR